MKKSIQITLSSIIIASSMHSYCYADTIPTNKSLTGKGVKVAVIDSGIDVTHPDLKQNYVKGYDFLDNDTVPEDRDGHGTHVAGIIAANGAMKGIAPDASILAYRVWGGSRGGPQAIIKAIEQAIKDGAQIINLSLGENIDGTDTPLNQAIRKAINRNITVVVAAGNAGPTQWSIHSLASTPEAITVGNAKAQGIKETILQIPGIQKEIGLHLLDKNQTLHTGEYGIVYLHDFNLDSIQKETDFKNKIVVIENADFNGEQAMNTLQELQKRGVVAILDSLNDENKSVKQYASLYRTMLNIQEKIPVLIGISKEEKGNVNKGSSRTKNSNHFK
ncbi:S8 family peptidase [Bacillus cereus]